MQTTRIFITSLRIAALILGFAILLTACKKDKPDPIDTDPCSQQVSPVGKLIKRTDGKFSYTTSGGGNILIDMHGFITITHDSYPLFKIQFWGSVPQPDGSTLNSGNHENLNGKHIKDRNATRRTFIFPDGAKLTMTAAAPAEPLTFISIYEGDEGHRISGTCNNVIKSSTTRSVSSQMDDEEADGEASAIEFTTTGLTWANTYQEDTPGNKIIGYVLLGKLERAHPNTVNDFYDDPRLGHT